MVTISINRFIGVTYGRVGNAFFSGLPALGNTITALLCLSVLGPKVFSDYSIIITFSAFTLAFYNAAACLPFIASAQSYEISNENDRLYRELNFIIIGSLAIFSFVLLTLLTDIISSMLSTTYIFGLHCRLFLKTKFLLKKNNKQAWKTDFNYTLWLLIFLSINYLTVPISLSGILTSMALANLAAIIYGNIFGNENVIAFLSNRNQVKRSQIMRAVWQDTSRWTILGVISGEISNNSPIYLVYLFAGPNGYAPLALAIFFYRPFYLMVGALTQYELPKMINAINTQTTLVLRSRRQSLINFFIIGLTSNIAAVVIYVLSTGQINQDLDNNTVIISLTYLGVLGVLRCIRIPMTIELQARKKFKFLAVLTCFTAPVSVIMTLFLCMLLPYEHAIVSVLLAEVCLISMIYLQYKDHSHNDCND